MIRSMTISLALGSLALAGLPGEGAAQTALQVELVSVGAAPRVFVSQLVCTVEAAIA